MPFKKIQDINLAQPSSWENEIFLTFDVDWCSDDVLSYTLDILEKHNTKATIFMTNNTPLINRIRANKNIELGLHPNFNNLLRGDFKYGKSIDDVLSYYKKIVPEAISVRSHSMTQNTHILDSFEKFNFIFECNTFIPFSSNVALKPYKHWTKKLIKTPFFWEDDIHCIYEWKWDVNLFLKNKGLKIFNFHPIHVFLNSENLTKYEASKKVSSHSELINLKNKRYGTESFLYDLIKN